MRPVYVIVLVLLFAPSVFAQESKCNLTLDKAPELRGLRLGMKIEDIGVDSPSLRQHYKNELGEGMEIIVPATLKDKDTERFKGIRNIVLHLLDDRLTTIDIGYDQSTTWRDTEEFVAKISEALNLPSVWKGSLIKRMDCGAFTLEAFAHRSTSRLTIKDPTAGATIEKRRKEKEDHQRQTFKP